MKLTIWADTSSFGDFSINATITDRDLDMTSSGWVVIRDIEIEENEEDIIKLLAEQKEINKEAKRAKLVAQLEALDNDRL